MASQTDRVCGLLPAVLLACVVPGCSLLRRPVPPPLRAGQVADVLRHRAEHLHTVTDTDISLTIAEVVDGRRKEWPSLGGILAFNADLPGLWLDAEKVTRRIFSLKALRNRFWLAWFDTREVITGGPAAYAKLPTLLRPDEVRSFFAGPEKLGLTWAGASMALEEEVYRFDVRVLGVLRRQVEVDRRDVVVRTIRTFDALGRVDTEIALARYRNAGGQLFPRRVTVARPVLGVTVELRLDETKLNRDLPERAFLPPDRPGWDVIDLDLRPLSDVRAFSKE